MEDKNWFEKLVVTEPAVIRSFFVSLAAVAALILGNAFTSDTVESVINFVVALFALIAGVWIRQGVVPTAKVVSYLPSTDDPTLVAAGEAVAAPTVDDADLLEAAKTKGD